MGSRVTRRSYLLLVRMMVLDGSWLPVCRKDAWRIVKANCTTDQPQTLFCTFYPNEAENVLETLLASCPQRDGGAYFRCKAQASLCVKVALRWSEVASLARGRSQDHLGQLTRLSLTRSPITGDHHRTLWSCLPAANPTNSIRHTKPQSHVFEHIPCPPSLAEL